MTATDPDELRARLTIAIDAAHETATALREFVDAHGRGSGAHYLLADLLDMHGIEIDGVNEAEFLRKPPRRRGAS